MRILVIAVLFGFSLIACSDLTNNYSSVEINEEFDINVGGIVEIKDVGLVIKFISVGDDSRCPIDAICVWEGNAVINLDLKNSDGDTFSAQLNTSLDPKQVSFSNLKIQLRALSPYPKSNETINPNSYIAKLLVTDEL
jgi:hypothetical protein